MHFRSQSSVFSFTLQRSRNIVADGTRKIFNLLYSTYTTWESDGWLLCTIHINNVRFLNNYNEQTFIEQTKRVSDYIRDFLLY